MGRVSQGEYSVIPNNNFYGKKCGKTIKDFTTDLDYKLNNAQDRIEFLNSRLEVSKIGDVEFAHDFFIELFDQTFDVALDKDGVYWVEEEQRHMNYSEFISWANRNNINIHDYLDIQTAFDEIEYEEGTKNKGSWNYSNINTSSVKLLLNSSDAQYSESNIASELSKLADYILAKDKEERKEKIKVYSEEDFKKRLYAEKNKLEPLEKVNGDDFIVLKRVENYRLAPKMTINSSDYKLPLIYRGTYEDYLEHWRAHQYKKVYLEGKYKKIYLSKKEIDNITPSVCMTEKQWIKGKQNILDKIKFLKEAEINRQALNDIKKNSLNGRPIKGVTKNIRDINEYMIMTKESYHDYVCIKPDKCPATVDIMEIIDYSNEKHILALVGLQGSKNDLENDIAILIYDVDNAIKESYDKGLLDKTDLEIIRLLRKGMLKEDISKKKNISRMTIHRRLKKIVYTVKLALQGEK